MKSFLFHFAILAALVPALAFSSALIAAEEQPYIVKPLAQRKVAQLPAGPLYWRVETFPSLSDAKAAVGPDGWDPAAVRYRATTALISEVDGSLIFDTPSEQMWETAIRRLGADPASLHTSRGVH